MSLQKRFKARYPKANFADSKQKISSGNRIYFFTTKPATGQLCLTTTEKISDRVFLLKRDEETTWSRTGFPS